MASSEVVHVIDDDADVRQSLAFLLSTAGIAVRVHESAIAFLQALPTIEGGCIVTDVRMPGMDGIALQRRLKADKSSIPVIVMTGHGDIAPAFIAYDLGISPRTVEIYRANVMTKMQADSLSALVRMALLEAASD